MSGDEGPGGVSPEHRGPGPQRADTEWGGGRTVLAREGEGGQWPGSDTRDFALAAASGEEQRGREDTLLPESSQTGSQSTVWLHQALHCTSIHNKRSWKWMASSSTQ